MKAAVGRLSAAVPRYLSSASSMNDCSVPAAGAVSDSYRPGEIRNTRDGLSPLHTANMKELILSPRWLGGKQILRLEFECDLPAPRLPHVAQVWLSASLKAAYGNQLA